MKKLNEVKEKAKNIWNEHELDIKIGACLTGFGIGAAIIGGLIGLGKGYEAGFIDGGCLGIPYGYKWLDEQFPGESKALELYESWMKAHPEDIVCRTGLGKWTAK